MIVGVPNYKQLHDTAVGWMNLAWEITTKELDDFHEAFTVFMMIEEERGSEKADAEAEKFWTAAQYKLNNATSLLQQSLEIFLKARIAEVSPFLLIVGEPQSWPRPEPSGDVDFSNFRTLDAVQLCRAVKIVSATPIPDAFIDFYDRLRRVRNKISHLNSGSIKAEASAILLDILMAHKFLFPDEAWVKFRRRYLDSTGQYSDPEGLYGEDDYTNDCIAGEIETVLHELEPKYAKLFFQFDPKKDALRCPTCLKLRTGWTDREWSFAQKQRGGKIKCAACLSVYTVQEYKNKIREYFGYLDKAEQKEIGEELDRELP